MVSALMILFLGCWLAGQSREFRQLPAPGPSISVRPSGVIALGQVVTIRCQCRCGARRLFLYKGGMEIQELDAAGDGGEFTIPSARWEDGGAYSCRSHSRSEPPDWSYPSDTVWIIVADLRYPKPSISLSPSGDVALGGAVTVQCRGRHQNVRFLLYKDGNPNALQNTEPAGNVAEFPIHSVSQRHAGSYSCYYYSHWNPPVWSHPSDPVELVVAGGTAPTQPEAAPNPTRPGSAGPGGSASPAPPGLASSIIAGVSAAAAVLLLLLLMAFVCFRITRARKGAAPRPSSTSPMGVLKTPAQQDPIYASIDEGKEPQTLPQEPDPGADGLTYVELDGQVLQAKRGRLAPAPAPAQPSVYAMINVSQGTPQ
nr:leukocyte immunoglobulin-like receptor subfamily B member 3 [Chrysemys picta bellii]